MNLYDIVKQLYPMETDSKIKRIAARIRDTGISEDVPMSRMSEVTRLAKTVANVNASVTARYNPLVDGARKSQAEMSHKAIGQCPICSQKMIDITLIGQRPATYCPSHHVVYPIPVQE